jgi:deoxyribodipyrimidine photo-lyase
MYKKSLYILRRDLRLNDNNTLINCVENSENVIFLFIFNPNQLGKDEFKNNNSLYFLANSLINLREKIRNLNIFVQKETELLNKLIVDENIDSIWETEDYTEYAKNRSKEIRAICGKYSIAYELRQDYLIMNPGEVLNESHSPYQVFTPFYNKYIKKLSQIKRLTNDISKTILDKIEKCSLKINGSVNNIEQEIIEKYNIVNEGLIEKKQISRKTAIQLLKMANEMTNYEQNRNFLYMRNTDLAPYLKFGLISVREFAQSLVITQGIDSKLLRQLIWREFWYHFHVLVWNRKFADPFKNEFLNYWDIKDDTNKEDYISWCEGRTGIEIVDACMIQLNKEGYMHNRGRMIVGSYLVKNLGIHWSNGEKYFARKLYDYDPIVNHWSWQWVAGCGTDAAPYYRVFNPILQKQKFDAEGLYTSKYVKYNVNHEAEQEKIKLQSKQIKDKYSLYFKK